MASWVEVLVAILIALIGWYWMTGFKVIYATYGRNREKVNIKRRLNSLIKSGQLKLVLDNRIPGKDPAPQIRKIGTIIYRHSGRIHKRQFLEGEMIDIP